VSANETAKKPRGRPFTKGNKANPAGRPRGSRNLAVRVLDAIGSESAEAVLQAVVRRARRGDMTAAAIILRRAWPEPKGRPVALDLPAVTNAEAVIPAIAEVVAAVGRGEVTTDEGEALVALIEAQRRAIETVELETRLRVLEERIRVDEKTD
jgi:hypothetical protein